MSSKTPRVYVRRINNAFAINKRGEWVNIIKVGRSEAKHRKYDGPLNDFEELVSMSVENPEQAKAIETLMRAAGRRLGTRMSASTEFFALDDAGTQAILSLTEWFRGNTDRLRQVEAHLPVLSYEETRESLDLSALAERMLGTTLTALRSEEIPVAVFVPKGEET